MTYLHTYRANTSGPSGPKNKINKAKRIYRNCHILIWILLKDFNDWLSKRWNVKFFGIGTTNTTIEAFHSKVSVIHLIQRLKNILLKTLMLSSNS